MVVCEDQRGGGGGGGDGSGASLIWFVTCFLFISIMAGGVCLLMYIIIPHDPATMSWLPVTGVALICLPWLFWIFTFIYRIITRVCIKNSNSSGIATIANVNTGGPVGGKNNTNAANTSTTAVSNEVAGDLKISDGYVRGGLGGQPAGSGIAKRSNSSLTNQSLVSHESELPLASSMVS